jgi:hypothetical protein
MLRRCHTTRPQPLLIWDVVRGTVYEVLKCGYGTYRGSAMIERPEATALFVRLGCSSNMSEKSQKQLPWCNPRKDEKGWYSGDIQAGSDQRIAMPWSMVKPSLHMTSFAERHRILLAPVLNQGLTPASTTSCRLSSARYTTPAGLCSVFNRGRLKDGDFSVEAGAGDPGADQRSRHLPLVDH